MSSVNLNARYQRLFITRSGYVPADRGALDNWLKKFAVRLNFNPRWRHLPSY